MSIEPLGAEAVTQNRAGLVVLLRDAVDSGASLGFLPPLGAVEAATYWDSVATALREGARRLLVARRPGEGIVGSVQLELATRARTRRTGPR